MRRSLLAAIVLVAVIAGVWILATPPTSGPDEPGHQIRAAALVRGQLDGQPGDFGAAPRAFELPAHIGFPDPGCYAFQPDVPASCASGLDAPEGEALLGTRSADYPIWGHVLPGVGSFAPGASSAWLARALDALVPILLVGAALTLAARRSALAVGATLLALTPMAWFSISVVNPSGLVIAGGVGLWVGLLALSGPLPIADERLARWTTAVSWAAMVLPRRDGLVWAALLLALAILIGGLAVRQLITRLGVGPLVVVALSTGATLVWAVTSDVTSVKALFLTPLAPIAAVVGRRIWRRLDRRRRWAAAAVAAVVAPAAMVAAMSLRTAGFDRAPLRVAITQTGQDLTEAVGLLGWLDTPIPTTAIFLAFVGVGLLAAAPFVVDDRRALVGAAAIVVAAVASSWTLTMLQNDPTGLYWQGRYYLPLLVGVPIVLGWVRIDRAVGVRLGSAAGVIGLVVLNAALAATMRRFGVGTAGSLVPTDWNTYGAVVPPVVLLGVHVVASVGLVGWAARSNAAARAERTLDDADRGVNVVGYHHVASGLGDIAREIHASLDAAGVPCRAIDLDVTESPALRPAETVTDDVFDTTIAVVAAPQLPGALDALPEVRSSTGRLVGYWFWELDTVPDEHHYAIGCVDEIWAPTHFVADAYGRAVDPGGPPVRLEPTSIPEPIVADGDVAAWRSELDLDGSFVFLTSLDLFSVVERKNPFATIAAFRSAFGDEPDRPVRLIVKTINGDRRAADLERIRNAAVDPRIDVVDRFVESAELDALIAAADCFVSLHRSEGLGLHLARAMWLRTPVVATRWSGNLDLMDDTCAALVAADHVPVTNGQGAYPDDASWAEPRIAEAATWMRRLVDDPAVGLDLAIAARRRMQDQPSRATVGRRMADALGLRSVATAR